MKPDITLSIVTGGNKEMLLEFLRSIKRLSSGVSCEIIILEYKKSDDTYEKVLEEFSEVKFIRARKIKGFGENHNEIAGHASGKYFAVLNDDMILRNNAFKIIVDYMEKNPKVGIAGARLHNPDGTIQPSAFTSFSTPASELYRTLRLDSLVSGDLTSGRDFTTIFGRCSGRHNEAREVMHLMGACLVFKKEIFDSLGGFDEAFKLGYEDQDICRRAALNGWRVVFFPDAEITHIGHQTIGKLGVGYNMKMLESRLFYHKKWNGAAGYFLARVFILTQALQVILISALRLPLSKKSGGAKSEIERGIKMIKISLGKKEPDI